MPAAPLPSNEAERLRELRNLGVLDTQPEREFDALVHAAALVCGVPISLVSLVDIDRQWFKANVGLTGVTETPREVAFCAHAIDDDGIFEVSDASTDARFKDNPLVTSAPGIRFYAGATLRLSNGARVGTLCVLDRKPHRLSEGQRAILRHLAAAAVAALESRKLAHQFVVSEARFRALSDAAPLGVYATDAQGACQYTNRHWQQIYGLDEPAALGDGWTRAVHPDDRAGVFAEWQRTAALQQPFDMEFRVLRPDGVVRHVRSVARGVLGDGGVLTGFVGSVEDISERVLARQTSEQLLSSVRERFIVSISDAGGTIVEVNDAFCALSQYSRADLIGADHRIVNSGLHGAAFFSLLWQQISAGASWRGDICNRAKTGALYWVDSVIVPMRGADGQVDRFVSIGSDATLRKQQEHALRKSEDLLNSTGRLADVGGWEFEVATATTFWSDQTCRIHGVAPGYVPILDEAIDFYAPEARPLIHAAMERGISHGEGWDLELPLTQAGGRRLWVRAVGHAVFEDGKAVRLRGAVQDITQRVLQRKELEAANERFTLATESGSIGVWDYDVARDQMRMDTLMRQLYEVPMDAAVDARAVRSLRLHPDDARRVNQSLGKALAGAASYEDEFRIIRSDGSMLYLSSSARITRDAEGNAIRIVGVNRDVTQLRILGAELAAQHELLRVTLQSIGDAVITTDASSKVTWLNPAAERMTGWTIAEALGRPLLQVFHIVHEETRELVDSPVAACLADDGMVGLASRTLLVARDGREFGIEDSAAPIRNAAGQVLGAVLVFHDVTEQRRLSGEMSYRATHDPLTDLVNRGEFEARLRRTLAKAHEDRSQHAMMYIDLDQFKLVNDACGHTVGDQLLKQVAKLLTETIRARDTLARLGGDEFAVILEHCSTEQAQRVAQQICDRMDDFRFLHEERRFRIGTSIGLVPLDSRWVSAAAAMQAADTSCYAAKEAGRNRVHTWFDTDLAMKARHGEMQWASRLEQAIDENRFALYAQRIESLGGGADALHAEVLLRLRDQNGKLVLPGAFFPAAERFHLASRIDRWVLRHSLEHLTGMPDMSRVQMLCINLSGQSIGDRAFHRDAAEMLNAAGPAACQRICLEITETAAVTNMADAAIFIEQVRALGVRIALDDFGAGASSFGYLKNLKVDLLKIDGQFIRDVVDDPLDDAAVRCFVDVARVVGVKTVAECVDKPEVLQRVRELGIDYAQGFLLHRPEPLEAVLASSLANA